MSPPPEAAMEFCEHPDGYHVRKLNRLDYKQFNFDEVDFWDEQNEGVIEP